MYIGLDGKDKDNPGNTMLAKKPHFVKDASASYDDNDDYTSPTLTREQGG